MSSAVVIAERSWTATRPRFLSTVISAVHAIVASPSLFFLATLTAMLFRPPDLKCCAWDRISFSVLICVAVLNLFLRRQPLHMYAVAWPLLALALLAIASTGQFDSQAWSLIAAKWIVPLALFQISSCVFRDESSLRKLEIFCLVVLIYLSAISALSLFGATIFIFPRFILDEGIGIHADRARGPFLQAVANGVSINMLGLVALDMFRKRRLPVSLSAALRVTVPLALLATKTRAVWLASTLCAGYVVFFSSSQRLRRAASAVCVFAILVGCSAWIYQQRSQTLGERLADESPVDFRLGMYRAGFAMFGEKPFAGWGSEDLIQSELARRIDDFHPEYYVFHNTYLEIAVKHGLIGLGLYVWLIVCLFRLGKNRGSMQQDFIRQLWPAMLGVYLLNAAAVVMNYQFVNGLLFTFAGILAARNSNDRKWSYGG